MVRSLEATAWRTAAPNGEWNVVVTILLVNADQASAQQLNEQFQAAAIIPYTYTPPSTTTALATWPTLQEMIAASTRLVTFVASLDPASSTVAPYLLDEFTFVFENPFDVTNTTDFSCTPDRPPSVQGNILSAIQSGRLPLMNHFLYATQAFGIQIPDIGAISNTNAPSGTVGNLGTAASNCRSVYGRAPTFILVDFFDEGPAISTVDTLNGITAVGRINPVSARVVTSTNSGTAFGKTLFSRGILLWTISIALVVLA